MSEETPIKPAADEPAAESGDGGYPPEVAILDLAGRRVVLVGTAHVSHSSVELVRRVIAEERPDRVCVELDKQRYESLSKKKQWEALDLKQVIRKQQLPTLLLNLVLAAYQKRLGGQLGIQPGTELLEATRVANEHGIPIELCDRDVRVTLRRAARRTSFFRRLMLLSEFLVSMFDAPEISEEQIQELKQQDVLNELLEELGRHLPALKEVLIDERDAYLAESIRESQGERLVAVVGAGHLRGIRQALESGRAVDLAALDEVPPSSPWVKVVGWGLPAVILGALLWIGWRQGATEAGDNLVFWFVANAVPTAIGAILALAHPVTIVVSALAAPFTSLTPVIGAGYVAAFVQTWTRPPVVKEFQTVADDLASPRRWWGNKLLRVFLVFVLTTLGSLIGSAVGGGKILTSLF
jgi:pheromone shutdown-related protein TraB